MSWWGNVIETVSAFAVDTASAVAATAAEIVADGHALAAEHGLVIEGAVAPSASNSITGGGPFSRGATLDASGASYFVTSAVSDELTTPPPATMVASGMVHPLRAVPWLGAPAFPASIRPPLPSAWWRQHPGAWAALAKGALSDPNTYLIQPERCCYVLGEEAASAAATTGGSSDQQPAATGLLSAPLKAIDREVGMDALHRAVAPPAINPPTESTTAEAPRSDDVSLTESAGDDGSGSGVVLSNGAGEATANGGGSSLHEIVVRLTIPPAVQVAILATDGTGLEALGPLRFDLVPRRLVEDDFWRSAAWRLELLAQTTSVASAMRLWRALNSPVPGQVIPGVTPTSASAADAPAAAAEVAVSIPTDTIAPRILRRLRVKANADVASDLWAAVELEMKKSIDRDEWQGAVSRRCRSELTPAISNAKMLKSLVAEVTTGTTATGATPPLELIRSVTETCRYHKGRVAALLAEIHGAPSDRTAGSELEPRDGAIMSLNVASPDRGVAAADDDEIAFGGGANSNGGDAGAGNNGGALYAQLVRVNAQLHDALAAAGVAGVLNPATTPAPAGSAAIAAGTGAFAIMPALSTAAAVDSSAGGPAQQSPAASVQPLPAPAPELTSAAPAAPQVAAVSASSLEVPGSGASPAPLGPMVFTAQLPWDDD